ncbi:hypothetical protein WS52_03320 [Burkholderia territorii]|nr:hypothetical protein WS52_03320 [Burkholderia territorii]
MPSGAQARDMRRLARSCRFVHDVAAWPCCRSPGTAPTCATGSFAMAVPVARMAGSPADPA